MPAIQHQIDIFSQGVSLAAEEEEIDRVRDEAESFGRIFYMITHGGHDESSFLYFFAVVECDQIKSSSNQPGLPQTILDSSNHSFFSSGPLPAYTARTSGEAPSGCKFQWKTMFLLFLGCNLHDGICFRLVGQWGRGGIDDFFTTSAERD